MDIDDVVARRFGQDSSRPGPYAPPRGTSWRDRRTEVIPGLIYRYELVDSKNESVVLQVYRGLHQNLAGQMWDQEVRVLLRAASLNHPALPLVLTGGHDDEVEPLGYVVTAGNPDRLDQVDDGLSYLKEHPEQAVRLFWLLADALATLHNMGTIHRNLWPGAITVEPGDQEPRLVLSRFEMSTVTANLLRMATLDHSGTHAIREMLLHQDRRSLAYAPPERLDFLFPEGPTSWVENDRSDVYGLGVTVWEWFYGPLPYTFDDLPDRPAEVRARAAQLHQALDNRLATDTVMPVALRDLIRDMIALAPKSRPTASGVAATINERFDAMIPVAAEATLPYLVTFAPREFVHVQRWGWIDGNPDTPDGELELAAFIQGDLAGAELIDSPEGAKYTRDAKDTADRKASTYLLLGRRAAWFCRLHGHRSPMGGYGPPLPEVLLVKYPIPYDSQAGRPIKSDFKEVTYRRRIHAVHVFNTNTDRAELDGQRTGRPSWLDLYNQVKSPGVVKEEEVLTGQAFDWLLDYQGAMLRAREYPYRLVGDGRSAVATIEYDEIRDEERRAASALDSRIAGNPRLRPPFADFFENIPDQETGYIEIFTDSGGRRSRLPWGQVTFDHSESDDVIAVRRHTGRGPLPAEGWLRPADDRGTSVALSRQVHARFDALGNRTLVDQIWNPRAISRPPGVFAGKGEGLGHDAVVRMLTSEPLFALQGPPGTGKTEVVAHAVGAFLAENPAARLLVSAQSNHALDNLALRIMQRLETYVPASQRRERFAFLRVAAQGAEDDERINRQMRPYRLAALARGRRAQLVDHARTWLVDNRGSPYTSLMTSWIETLADAEPELADRLRRGASVVFATCTTSTRKALADFGSAAAFEWVIIEEAAKAWPTELAMPLARGARWTLVGDQQQLPAHRRNEVCGFLAELAHDPNAELKTHGERYDAYVRVFNLFGSLFDFEHRELTQLRRADGSTMPMQQMQRPLVRLSRQFRMRDPICQVVSRVFYPLPTKPGDDDPLPPGGLTTGRQDGDHGLRSPGWLDGRALVWLDTSEVAECADEEAWCNKGEAQVVAEFIAALRPFPTSTGRAGDDPLMVLTPYRKQAELLRTFAPIKDSVSTIHAYQGREADIVVVSLVRDRRRGPRQLPWRNIGHLTQPELVNVMLSRARDLLVIVGSFKHFRTSGSPDWEKVCLAVERYGVVRNVERTGLR